MTASPPPPAHPPGILSLSPRVLQCEECGVTADAATVGLPETALKQPQLVHLLSGLRFHAHSWPDGRTDNPRLCRACRLARGCHCWSCDWERGGSAMSEPYYTDEYVTLWHGDCLDVLQNLPAGSVDAVVTDPPYGLEFMGRKWDRDAGFLESLSATGRGSRVATERAGELTERGSGHSTSAGPYLAAGVDSVRVAGRPFQAWCEQWAAECLRVLKPGGMMLSFGGTRTWHRLACAIEDSGFEVRDSIAWLYGSGFPKSLNVSKAIAADADAAGWEGWGTALKPAFEPIVVARKPLAGTVAATVLAHGTGALNIDACRVPGEVRSGWQTAPGAKSSGGIMNKVAEKQDPFEPSDGGRFPPNVLLDESQADALDRQAGERVSGAYSGERSASKFGHLYGDFAGTQAERGHEASRGGASRFFPTFRYEAKAPASERPRVDGIAHPTVKPLDLMRWLVRLVTPPGGTVLEPFAGSGTTVEACIVEGFHCIAIEREAEYLPLIEQRIYRRRDPVAAIRLAGDDLGLFDTEKPA